MTDADRITSRMDDGTKLTRLMLPYYRQLLQVGWTTAGESVDIGVDFSLELVEVQRVLGKTLQKRMKGICDTTKEQIRGRISQQAREGRDVAWLRDEIRAIQEMTPARAEMIARTESATAYTQGSMVAYEASGQVEAMEWLLGPESCDICQEIAAETPTVNLGDTFYGDVDGPPAHPHCTCAISPVLRDR